ncbi:hypothetical protein Q604_UNBC02995G0001, partial [human gut metagenome]
MGPPDSTAGHNRNGCHRAATYQTKLRIAVNHNIFIMALVAQVGQFTPVWARR